MDVERHYSKFTAFVSKTLYFVSLLILADVCNRHHTGATANIAYLCWIDEIRLVLNLDRWRITLLIYYVIYPVMFMT